MRAFLFLSLLFWSFPALAGSLECAGKTYAVSATPEELMVTQNEQPFYQEKHQLGPLATPGQSIVMRLACGKDILALAYMDRPTIPTETTDGSEAAMTAEIKEKADWNGVHLVLIDTSNGTNLLSAFESGLINRTVTDLLTQNVRWLGLVDVQGVISLLAASRSEVVLVPVRQEGGKYVVKKISYLYKAPPCTYLKDFNMIGDEVKLDASMMERVPTEDTEAYPDGYVCRYPAE